MATTMTTSQINDFLSRNGSVSTLITEFEALDLFGTYSQIVETGSITDDFLTWLSGEASSPIPANGLVVQDAVYGQVVIFPDANGNLDYTSIPVGESTGSATPYQGGGASLLPSLSQIGSSVTLGLLIIALFYMYRATEHS